jgi:hypothetical protein
LQPVETALVIGRDQRARSGRGLDHHHDPRQAADEAIPARKAPGMRPLAWWELRQQQSALTDALVQPPVGRRIDDAEAVPKHPDRGAARVERGCVRHRVEAARHAAHNNQAGPASLRRDGACYGLAVGSVVAAADDGECRALEQRQVAEGEEHWRRIGDEPEQRGERGVVGHEDGGAQALYGFHQPAAGDERRLLDGGGTGGGHPGQGAQKRERRRMGAEWGVTGIEQYLEAGRSETGDLRQRQVGVALMAHLLIVHELPVARHVGQLLLG